MAYTDSKALCISEGVADSATAGFAASGTAVCRVNQPCTLYAVGAIIRVTLTVNAAAITVTRRSRVLYDTDATNVAVITIPTLTAAGKIVYIKGLAARTAANLLPVQLNAGDELKFVCDSGGGAIYWQPWFEAYPTPEIYANNSDFLLSA